MAYPTLKCLMLLYFFSLFILSSSSFPITLQLSRKIRSKNTRDLISEIAKTTRKRAHNLRHHHRNKYPSTSTTPLYPISDPSEYVISLSLGTPPQKLPVVFDTGSSLVWVPCTSNYFCTNCTQTEANIAVFKPKRSSSKRSVNCSDKKCRWLDTPVSIASCPGCSSCRRPCAYAQSYGSGSTIGHTISDNLNLQGKVVPGFIVGCSSYSDVWPQGIVGFGRSPKSLPNQINLNKFSYCLVSHNFDDTTKSSRLILGDSGDVVQGMNYTPLVKNPPMEPYNEFYYVQLEEITIGKHIVKLPQEILVLDNNGNGGTIVDSGSTFSLIVSTLFDPIIKEFMAQISPAQRNGVVNMQAKTGNIICVNVTTGQERLEFPEIVFHFKGGVKMDLGVANYFDNGGNQLCLPLVNSTFVPSPTGFGPAVILGNYQQFDFNIEFDLRNQRLGVKRQNCDQP